MVETSTYFPYVCKCEKCGQEFAAHWEFAPWCYDCVAADRRAVEERQQQYERECMCNEVRASCPTAYLETDPSKLPQEPLGRVLAWTPDRVGLLLVGPTGAGKTRCAWLLIHKLATERGIRPMVFDAVAFTHQCASAFSSGEDHGEVWANDIASADLVFLDDVGKFKLTERSEAELFGMVERRFSWKRPLIITTNDDGDSISGRMTGSRGPALVRRLREFCEVVTFR